MNFRTPLSSLFPGTSGRLLTALVDHHLADAARPVPLADLSKNAAVAPAQIEAALFRLGLLGLVAPRRNGEAVRIVPGHIAWGALSQLANLRDRVVDAVLEQTRARLYPVPAYLALSGAVVEGTAAHPADVLELIMVPPVGAPPDWDRGVSALVAQLSRDLGNVVVHRIARDTQEAEDMGGAHAVCVLPSCPPC
ncbi:hypothetical protein ACIQVL_19390 [Streptomyces sp. NPDC090499]|uniref:hypothetical protein n=1 Tax=unclassified Streptomyces TaxID=2593676 RepID=UPI0038266832